MEYKAEVTHLQVFIVKQLEIVHLAPTANVGLTTTQHILQLHL